MGHDYDEVIGTSIDDDENGCEFNPLIVCDVCDAREEDCNCDEFVPFETEWCEDCNCEESDSIHDY